MGENTLGRVFNNLIYSFLTRIYSLIGKEEGKNVEE